MLTFPISVTTTKLSASYRSSAGTLLVYRPTRTVLEFCNTISISRKRADGFFEAALADPPLAANALTPFEALLLTLVLMVVSIGILNQVGRVVAPEAGASGSFDEDNVT